MRLIIIRMFTALLPVLLICLAADILVGLYIDRCNKESTSRPTQGSQIGLFGSSRPTRAVFSGFLLRLWLEATSTALLRQSVRGVRG
jgi:hypothetical protein